MRSFRYFETVLQLAAVLVWSCCLASLVEAEFAPLRGRLVPRVGGEGWNLFQTCRVTGLHLRRLVQAVSSEDLSFPWEVGCRRRGPRDVLLSPALRELHVGAVGLRDGDALQTGAVPGAERLRGTTLAGASLEQQPRSALELAQPVSCSPVLYVTYLVTFTHCSLINKRKLLKL